MNAAHSDASFMDKFMGFLSTEGRTKGQKRANKVYENAQTLLEAALTLQKREIARGACESDPTLSAKEKKALSEVDCSQPDTGVSITSGWCFSFKANAVGAYVKKIGVPPSMNWGVVLNFKLLNSGLNAAKSTFTKLLEGKPLTAELKLSAGVLIGFVPGKPVIIALRAGVAVGGTLTIKKDPNLRISVGLGIGVVSKLLNGYSGWSAFSCGLGPTIGPFACVAGVAASFTMWCMDFNFLTGENSDLCLSMTECYNKDWEYSKGGYWNDKVAKDCGKKDLRYNGDWDWCLDNDGNYLYDSGGWSLSYGCCK